MTLTSWRVVQEWGSVGSTLGQVALGQLAAVTSHSLDNVETRACCLSLMGKYFRLLAVQEDPIYLCALWDRHKQVDNANVHIYMYTRLLHRGFSLALCSRLNMMEFEHCRGISRNGMIKLEMETLKTQDTICLSSAPTL